MHDTGTRFTDRTDAGRRLAARLGHLRGPTGSPTTGSPAGPETATGPVVVVALPAAASRWPPRWPPHSVPRSTSA